MSYGLFIAALSEQFYCEMFLEAECGKVCLVPANLVRFIDSPETDE